MKEEFGKLFVKFFRTQVDKWLRNNTKVVAVEDTKEGKQGNWTGYTVTFCGYIISGWGGWHYAAAQRFREEFISKAIKGCYRNCSWYVPC